MAAPPAPAYRPLSESPLAVGETNRRARYWYSGGPRLDQGPEGAAVGFAWTIWAADRGLRLADGDFDEEFARELNTDSQKLAGIEEAGGGGSFVWAGERALRDRRLVYTSFACPDRDSIVLALLERGPLVAGVTWMIGMDTPVWIDGRCVSRAEKDAPRGGHALVFNGIDLDLEIDGVRGFVRMRNSWGALWGDDGQALVSLDDFMDVVQADTVLLPVPPPDVLGPDGNPEIADPESPPGGYGPQSIGSDLWTTQDTVGYAAYAEAIARGIQHGDTTPPLTIGIKAPWGAGKTSLMRMIRDRLEWPSGKRTNAQRKLRLVGHESEEVTNRDVLERAQADDEEKLRATLKEKDEDADERRWRATVWFNPWMYQTGEQVWAGLAHEMITQITDRMEWRERERFWLELNIRRVDEQAVRRRIYALVLEKLVPWGIAGALVLVAGLALLAVDAVAGAIAVLAGPLGVAGAAVVQWRSVLGARPTGALAKLVTPVTDKLIHAPDYATQSGFFYLLQTDVQRVLDLVATPRRPLVVFVDDLDRCSPGTVVQVIEAINLFLAGQYPNCIFVIAMEPDMVAAHVEAAYGSLAERLEENGADFDLGWRFLEKIVQLPLTLPTLEPGRAAGFAESLFSARDPEPESPPDGADSEAAVAAAEDELRDADLAGVVDMASAVAPAGAEAEAVRRSVARLLTIDDPEVRRAIAYAAGHLDANPREIKRFVNVFRFLVMIHTERAIEGLTTTASLEQLAKLALVSTRWPELMSTLARHAGDITVFELLEKPPGKTLRAQLTAARVPKPIADRLLGDRLRPVLRAEPTVGPAARHYL